MGKINNKIQLYNYYRSSCSYRVRIALHIKNISFEYIPVHLIKNGGEQHSEEYKRLNPEGQVPCLVHNNHVITQSMAILQYLEDLYPSPVLFPKEKKTQVISLCEIINSGVQPLQNLTVLKYLKTNWSRREEDRNKWLRFWIQKGLSAVEKKVRENKWGPFAIGRTITAAELFIIPQIYNAKRFNVNLKNFPKLLAIEELCQNFPAFKKAHPDTQPDSPSDSRKKE